MHHSLFSFGRYYIRNIYIVSVPQPNNFLICFVIRFHLFVRNLIKLIIILIHFLLLVSILMYFLMLYLHNYSDIIIYSVLVNNVQKLQSHARYFQNCNPLLLVFTGCQDTPQSLVCRPLKGRHNMRVYVKHQQSRSFCPCLHLRQFSVCL